MSEHVGVDRDGIGAHPHGPAAEPYRLLVGVGGGVEHVDAALQEVVDVVLRVEGDDVVGEQAAEDLLADLAGQHPPGVGLRPGDVHELLQERPRRAGPHDRGDSVQVVVVDDHDPAAAVVAQLVEDGFAEQSVDRQVALAPGVELVLADVGMAGEVPEVVLDEPEDGVGRDVVVAVVGLALGRHVAHLVGLAVQVDAQRLSGGGELLFFVARRRRDPDAGMAPQHGADHGHEAAGAARDHRLSRRVAVERYRAAVGRDDQVGAFGRRLCPVHNPPPFPASSRRRLD